MALSDLAVFSEWVYTAQTEILRQQIDLFNSAARGAIVLRTVPHTGDYSDSAFWAKISGLVRRRNPYATGAVAAKELVHLVDTMVKIAAGTPPVNMPPSQFRWIQRNPEEGGAVVGQQLAVDTLADMLNVALMAARAALAGQSAIIADASNQKADHSVFNTGQSKFGDHYQDIVTWVMHSKPLFDIYGSAIANDAGLFNFGTINVKQDGFGRTFIITDSPSLIDERGPSPGDDLFFTLGLVPGAIRVHQNDDFDDNFDTENGDENIQRTYQAEWSYELGIKGFAWDKTHGGHAPNDAALAVTSNWDRTATSHKDLAGVLVKTL